MNREIPEFHPDESSHQETKAEIAVSKRLVDVQLNNIELEEGVHETLGRLIIKGKKAPLEIADNSIIDVVKFSEKSDLLDQIIHEAEHLATVENEKERIDALLKLLKKYVTYGYEEVLEAKAEEHGIVKEELDKLGAKGNRQIEFAEMVKYGVGVCGHLSAAYLYLANKAKLRGIIAHSHPSFTPTNIVRNDTKNKLFKSFDIGAKTANHAWVEIQLQDGTWIPIDPSTEITGTTPGGMQTFKEAGYLTQLIPLDFDYEEGSKLGSQGTDEFNGVIPTGASDIVVDVKIGLRKILSLRKQSIEREKRVVSKPSEKITISSSNTLGNINFEEVTFEGFKD